MTPRFAKARQLLNDNLDLAISQCRSYREAWYPQGEVANAVNMKYELTDSMSSNLETINRNSELLKSDELRFQFMSGGMPDRCRDLLIRLRSLHDDMALKANGYHSLYEETVMTEAASKKTEINEAMGDCRE